jgi:5'-3' exonuclease
LLVDGNALFKQAYYGAKNEYTTKSVHEDTIHVGGLVQFLRILRNFLFENYYNKVYVFWDGLLSGQMRYDLYPEYKQDRGKDYVTGNIPNNELLFQMFQIKGYLTELGIRQFGHKIVESDDFIAYYCGNKLEGEKVTIFSNDRDLCQLLSEDVRVYLCDKKAIVTRENYREHFSHHPDNSLLVKIICGDRSDCIKGVKGVKEKTLLEIMPEIADRKVTLEEVLQRAREINDQRLAEKKKPLQSVLNILEPRTDGSQGKRLYEINHAIMDLKMPLMDEEILDDFHIVMENPIIIKSDAIKSVMGLMKRDGIYHIIGEHAMESFLMPYKKIIEREKKFLNETENGKSNI